MKAETIIYCLFSALKPFRRNKTLEKKIRAAELYLRGLTYTTRRNLGNQPHNSLGDSPKTRRIRLHAENPRSEETKKFYCS